MRSGRGADRIGFAQMPGHDELSLYNTGRSHGNRCVGFMWALNQLGGSCNEHLHN